MAETDEEEIEKTLIPNVLFLTKSRSSKYYVRSQGSVSAGVMCHEIIVVFSEWNYCNCTSSSKEMGRM